MPSRTLPEPTARVEAAPSFSLVLGAGGRPGMAYHAGTLLALGLHGIRPADAASITGTSAGSLLTAILAGGADVEDIAAYTVGATPRAAFRTTERLVRVAEARTPKLELRAVTQLADPRRVQCALGHLRARRLSSALASFVPGVLGIATRFQFLDTLGLVDPFPPWRIVAADGRARRHVLTAGQAPLSLAVAASCAIPGLFAPVRHHGRALVDGGLHSTTNADLAGGDRGGTVIVIAPMCSPTGSRLRFARMADEALERERVELDGRGKQVLVFRPSLELRGLMGWNPLSARHSREITAAAVLEAADLLPQLGPRRRTTQPLTAQPSNSAGR